MFVEASRIRTFVREAKRYRDAVHAGVHPDETGWSRAYAYVAPLVEEPAVVIDGVHRSVAP